MDEKGEPLIDNPPQSEPIEGADTFCDAPMDDPAAAVRFAGCSMETEIISLEVKIS